MKLRAAKNVDGVYVSAPECRNGIPAVFQESKLLPRGCGTRTLEVADVHERDPTSIA
jgi:hypothetical protein